MSLRSVFENLRQGLISASHLGQTRLQLFSIELQEELEKQASRLIWILAAFVFASLSLIAASVLLWVVFWDTHRICIGFAFIFLYGLLSVVCLAVLRYRAQRASPPFSVTMEEFRRDRVAMLEKKQGE